MPELNVEVAGEPGSATRLHVSEGIAFKELKNAARHALRPLLDDEVGKAKKYLLRQTECSRAVQLCDHDDLTISCGTLRSLCCVTGLFPH
jgi:hypothetical protein